MVSKKKLFFFLIEKNRHGIGKKGGYFRLGIAPREGQKIPCIES